MAHICTVCKTQEIVRPSWCRSCIKEYQKRYALINRTKILQHKAKWRNSNREKQNELVRNWAKRNPKRILANVRAYQIKKFNKWLPLQYRKQIRRIYEACPLGHHVDHIVPLRGKIVSGLHVPWNLQYLEKSLNHKKGNKHE